MIKHGRVQEVSMCI